MTSSDDQITKAEAESPKGERWSFLPKTKNGRLTVVAVIAAVVIVACVGLWSWASSPGFCSALCHSPMEAYVASYESGDKGMGAARHAEAGMNCPSCHSRSTVRQIGEFAHWATDSYTVDQDGFLVKDGDLATKEYCTQSGCHTWEAIVDATWGFAGNGEQYNPHASHEDGSITCSDCHKMHQKSELYCAKCHELNLPEGWEATNDQ